MMNWIPYHIDVCSKKLHQFQLEGGEKAVFGFVQQKDSCAVDVGCEELQRVLAIRGWIEKMADIFAQVVGNKRVIISLE